MKSITVLVLFFVGLVAFTWGFAALKSCLLPIELPEDDPRHNSQVFPSREGIFLSTMKRTYLQGLSSNFVRVAKEQEEKYANVVDLVDTPEGVYMLTGIGTYGGLYYYMASEGLNTVLEKEDRENYVKLEQTSDGVFVFLKDEIIKLDKWRRIYDWLKIANQCTMSYKQHQRLNSLIIFQTRDSICKLKGNRLDLITLTNPEGFGTLTGAAETSYGVFFWGNGGVYLLNEDNRAKKIADMPANLIYETLSDNGLGRVFISIGEVLFTYSQEEGLIRIPGIEPGYIHSIHEIGSNLYALASHGVFHLSKAGGPERIWRGSVRGPGVETREGVFFITSSGQTYRLTDSTDRDKVSPVTLPGHPDGGQTEKPWEIKNTRVGPLLATDRSLYRFSEENNWVPVPSGDLGGDVHIIIPIDKKDGVTADVPVFVDTQNDVFEWIESPWGVKSLRAAWNYIVIFWWQVVIIVVCFIGIIIVVVYYSLYSYRWVGYYLLGLVAPSRVHNQIFINYRWDDTWEEARSLFSALGLRFDKELIFLDNAEGRIDSGARLPSRIHDAVEQCTVLLALIGSRWLDVQSANGSRRLDDPNDYVRQEIALALERGKRVIPIRLRNVPTLEAQSLPEPLKQLADLKAKTLGEVKEDPIDTYKKQIDELSRELVTFPTIPPAKRC